MRLENLGLFSVTKALILEVSKIVIEALALSICWQQDYRT
jgi:hypothetical protein